MEEIQELPGIGPWTANYIAMRALRGPMHFRRAISFCVVRRARFHAETTRSDVAGVAALAGLCGDLALE